MSSDGALTLASRPLNCQGRTARTWRVQPVNRRSLPRLYDAEACTCTLPHTATLCHTAAVCLFAAPFSAVASCSLSSFVVASLAALCSVCCWLAVDCCCAGAGCCYATVRALDLDLASRVSRHLCVVICVACVACARVLPAAPAPHTPRHPRPQRLTAHRSAAARPLPERRLGIRQRCGAAPSG
jgi:hypothetical protein